jgi:hypothetical protein
MPSKKIIFTGLNNLFKVIMMTLIDHIWENIMFSMETD